MVVKYKKNEGKTDIKNKKIDALFAEHKEDKKSKKSPLKDSLYTAKCCIKCGTIFVTLDAFEKHMQTHADIKVSNVVDDMKKKAKNRKKNERSASTDSDEQNMCCRTCGKNFATKEMYRKHVATHIDENLGVGTGEKIETSANKKMRNLRKIINDFTEKTNPEDNSNILVEHDVGFDTPLNLTTKPSEQDSLANISTKNPPQNSPGKVRCFICNICDLEFRRNSDVKNHIQKLHKVENFDGHIVKTHR